MSQPAQPTAACLGNHNTSFIQLLECGSGGAANSNNTSARTLATTIAASFASLGVQLLIFVLLRLRLTRIYQPRTYLVPENQRTSTPPGGLIGWLYPLFTVSNRTLIDKCGLDAYFFLRYLQALLKIFIPVAFVVLPILLPINATGKGNAKGLDRLSITNLGQTTIGNRLWAQLILAILVILWVFYVIFQELRSYVRVRQAFLTSPQHRIRASATTVLVTGIPRKWLTMEALSGLYDVYPGGIRNIWINRNYQALADKVSLRDKYAHGLESAETNLIKACRQNHMKEEKKRLKKAGGSKETKQDKQYAHAEEDAAAVQMSQNDGVSAGAQYKRTSDEADSPSVDQADGTTDNGHRGPLGFVGRPFDAVGQGIGAVGKGVTNLTSKVVGGVGKVNNDFDKAAGFANKGGIAGGFTNDDSLYFPDSSARDDPSHRAFEDRPPWDERARSPDAYPSKPVVGQQQSYRHPRVEQSSPSAGLHSDSPNSEKTRDATSRDSEDSTPPKAAQGRKPSSSTIGRKLLNFFHVNDESIVLPSPQPHTTEEGDIHEVREEATSDAGSKGSWKDKLMFWKSKPEEPKETYRKAYNEDLAEDLDDDEAVWRKYIKPKERETMHLPLLPFLPGLPFIGKKVDKVYYLRRELARLNLEIEADQSTPDKFPLMNSAFIQFNHQIAAHMCCQSLSHHVPQQMAPRLLEISPDDIIWDNMAVKWWERYLRTAVVLLISAGLIIFYAIPVAFTSLLYNISLLGQWFPWLRDLPPWALAAVEGIVPSVLLSVILSLVPLIFQFLIRQQGVPTRTLLQLGVQTWYFTFLFIQVFLVVTISGGLIALFKNIASNPFDIATKLATSFPQAADYFYSYLTLQALSNAASALAQVGALFSWFFLAPILDSTARAKWRRQVNLSNWTWGTFFPPFTNFAVIGIIYSVIAPLILPFMIVIFTTFLVAYRYSVLYTVQFKHDTGGLLFPVALQQLLVGVYFLELCLIGIFFTAQDENGKAACIPQGVIMVVFLVLTIIAQWLLKSDFAPLLQYLPITLEDEAVVRDEAFAKQQESKFASLREGDAADDSEDIEDTLKRQEDEDRAADEAAEDAERQDIDMRRRSGGVAAKATSDQTASTSALASKAQRPWHHRTPSKPTWKTDKWKKVAPEAVARLRFLADGTPVAPSRGHGARANDEEAQRTVGDVLYSGFADELEDLSPDDRDLLVRYAFQSSALRARRPVVWIPRDRLGVSDDEIRRAERMSTVKELDEDDDEKEREESGKEQTFIWMSNAGTALDSKGRVVFGRSPPDFSNVDLITL